MSLADQVTNLTNDRNNIRTALVNKGITEAASHGFSSFDDDIDAMVKPEGTITVTENGEYDVTEREGIIVDVYTVTPIESPEAEIGDLKSGGTLHVVWNTVSDAICYTLERKHGDNGVWTVIRTLAISAEESYEYVDVDVIPGNVYSYRVYAISNGAVYGNSLASNIATATAPYGGGVVNLFAPNDFCEDVTGGWIVEPYPCDPTNYPPMDIEPYTPEITSDGYMYVIRGGSYSSANSAIWLRTVNPINFKCNKLDIMERVYYSYKRMGSLSYIQSGLYKKTGSSWSVVYKFDNSSTSFLEHRFLFNDDGSISGVYNNIPPGDYYVGFMIYKEPAMSMQVSSCMKLRVTYGELDVFGRWAPYIYDGTKVTDPEISDISGGYIPSNVVHYNPSEYTVKTPIKEIYTSGEKKIMDIKYGDTSTESGVCALVSKNMIECGGFDYIEVSAIRSGNTKGEAKLRFVFLDENKEFIGVSLGASLYTSSWLDTNLEIPDIIRNGGKYYIEILLNGIYEVRIEKMCLTYKTGG